MINPTPCRGQKFGAFKAEDEMFMMLTSGFGVCEELVRDSSLMVVGPR
jgi:hypothetical protein